MTLKEEANKQIKEIKKILEKEKITTESIEKKTYNYEFKVRTNNNNFKILVYFGKKGIKTILQGNSTSAEYRRLYNIIFDETEFDFVTKGIEEPAEYIGSDECGKGDFFGPLVVGAVYVNFETQKKLKVIGVRDSKELNQNQIYALSIKIKEIINPYFEVIQINPVKYNELYTQFNNLNKLLDWAHSKAVNNLLSRIKCKTVITDKFSNKDLKISFSPLYNNVEFIQTNKAERYTGVAAASILARNAFNRWFMNNNIKGNELPKGSSNQIERVAKQIIDIYGLQKLGYYAKLHFKTYKKILET